MWLELDTLIVSFTTRSHSHHHDNQGGEGSRYYFSPFDTRGNGDPGTHLLQVKPLQEMTSKPMFSLLETLAFPSVKFRSHRRSAPCKEDLIRHSDLDLGCVCPRVAYINVGIFLLRLGY